LKIGGTLKTYHGDSGAKRTPIMMGTGQIH
jgi:hypothetical protein